LSLEWNRDVVMHESDDDDEPVRERWTASKGNSKALMVTSN